MIGVDWGTSNLRAYRLAPGGAVLERRESGQGILEVPTGGFAAALEAILDGWLAGAPPVLLCGMVGSRQGWVEAPYLACPAGAAEIAGALTAVPWAGGRAWLIPGLRTVDAHGVPDVLRGEETKLVGLLEEIGEASALVCLPGTHPKWVRVAGGRIVGFATHMTGEVRAALLGHTILGRTAPEGEDSDAGFARGVARSGDAGGLLHHLFGTRALHLMGELAEAEGAGYLGGLLIGHEVRAAVGGEVGATVHLAGAPRLVAAYARAFELLGVAHVRHGQDLVASGLARIGRGVA